MFSQLKYSLFCTAATALVPFGAAHAQETVPPAAAETAIQDQVSGDGEIIVTATRNEASITKVPISISAFNQEGLDRQGVKDVSDLATISPGVTFDEGISGTSVIAIRGITSQSGAATTGIYLDDTPIQSRALGAGQTFSNAYPEIFDLDRVEVLRGPQGTLFGAGSQGGTIRFITPQPSVTEYSGYARGELAFTEHGDPSYEIGGAVGGPIVDNLLGFRVSAYHSRDGGYIDRVNPLTGNRIEKNANYSGVTALRGALTLAPADSVKITPAIFYQNMFQNEKSAYWGYLTDKDKGRFRNGAQISEPLRDKMLLPSLAISADLGLVELVSNTSYFYRKAVNRQNFTNFLTSLLGFPTSPGNFVPGAEDYGALGLDHNRQKAFTQEVRLQSTGSGPLRWVVGVFYQRSRQTAEEVVPETLADFNRLSQALFGADGVDVFGVPLTADGNSFVNRVRGTDEQIAGFADVTYNITDELSATVGARYAKTKFNFTTFGDGPYNGGPSSAAGRQSEKPFTPKFNISYQADSSNLFYATAAKGFRVGGANAPLSNRCAADLASLGLAAAPTSYDSDSVWSYELGSKNRLGTGVQISSSVFLVDWSKIQQVIQLPGCGFSFVSNVGKARSKGFDIQADVRVSDALTLNGSLSYTDAKYTRTVLGGVTPGGDQAILVNKGNSLDAAPWVASLSAQYEFELGGEEAYARLDYQYSSRRSRNTPENDPTTSSYRGYPFVRPALHLLGARVGGKLGPVDASLFVENIFDYKKDLYLLQLNDATNRINEYGTERPRTFGLTVSYRY
jgi:outer membrane receptor protein involved in Fe transport